MTTNKDDKITFYELLVKRCKEELEVEMGNIDLFDMNNLSDEMIFTQSKDDEQEVMNEFAKHENKYLRRRIAFTRMVKHLYNFDTISPIMIHGWFKQLLANQSDKALEFFCMLMKALGNTFEADTKVWLIASKDEPGISDLSVYMEELKILVEKRKTSMKVRFMMMVVIKLQGSGWKKKERDTSTSKEDTHFGEASKTVMNIPSRITEYGNTGGTNTT